MRAARVIQSDDVCYEEPVPKTAKSVLAGRAMQVTVSVRVSVSVFVHAVTVSVFGAFAVRVTVSGHVTVLVTVTGLATWSSSWIAAAPARS